jgi:hypothetical protein
MREQRLIADNAVDHGRDFALAQPIDSKGCDMRLPNPRRLKFGPVRNNQQHAKGSYPVHRSTKHFKARGIGPVRIFKDHQQGTSPSYCLDLCYERFKRALSALIWG